MAESLTGARLAEAAYLLARPKDPHHQGLEIPDLVRLLEGSGIRITSEDPWTTLRSALNADQAHWLNHDGLWVAVEEIRPVGTELAGRPLSDEIYRFVRERYTSDRLFHYEMAKEAMLRTGVRIKGRATGPTMRKALAGSPDRFELVPSRGRGWWRWKEKS